jgi:hypothetical protein
LKRLVKKYPSLKSDFALLLDSLAEQPGQGIAIGRNCYKIRLAITSKGKGKSGGARVITNFVWAENTVFLLTIYDKAEQASLSDKEIKELLKLVPG